MKAPAYVPANLKAAWVQVFVRTLSEGGNEAQAFRNANGLLEALPDEDTLRAAMPTPEEPAAIVALSELVSAAGFQLAEVAVPGHAQALQAGRRQRWAWVAAAVCRAATEMGVENPEDLGAFAADLDLGFQPTSDRFAELAKLNMDLPEHHPSSPAMGYYFAQKMPTVETAPDCFLFAESDETQGVAVQLIDGDDPLRPPDLPIPEGGGVIVLNGLTVGPRFDPRYGEFTITYDHLVDSISNTVRPIAIDWAHVSEDRTAPAHERAESQGWVYRWQIVDGGKRTIGYAVATKKLYEGIKAGNYRYTSPVFLPNAPSKVEEKAVGLKIYTIAVTPSPVLDDQLGALAASESLAAYTGRPTYALATRPSVTPGDRSMLTAWLLSILGLDGADPALVTATRARLLSQFQLAETATPVEIEAAYRVAHPGAQPPVQLSAAPALGATPGVPPVASSPPATPHMVPGHFHGATPQVPAQPTSLAEYAQALEAERAARVLAQHRADNALRREPYVALCRQAAQERRLSENAIESTADQLMQLGGGIEGAQAWISRLRVDPLLAQHGVNATDALQLSDPNQARTLPGPPPARPRASGFGTYSYAGQLHRGGPGAPSQQPYAYGGTPPPAAQTPGTVAPTIGAPGYGQPTMSLAEHASLIEEGVDPVEVPVDHRLSEPVPAPSAERKPGLYGNVLVLSDNSELEIAPDEAAYCYGEMDRLGEHWLQGHVRVNYKDAHFTFGEEPKPQRFATIGGRN